MGRRDTQGAKKCQEINLTVEAEICGGTWAWEELGVASNCESRPYQPVFTAATHTPQGHPCSTSSKKPQQSEKKEEETHAFLLSRAEGGGP